MDLCSIFQFLKDNLPELLTYLALVLAFIAYAWSVNRDLNSWKSLFISFSNDLEAQKGWLKNEYSHETYNDKNSFDPFKIIFPLTFESLGEIIRRGVAELPKISRSFIKSLSIFNERVFAFNSILDHIKLVSSSNPILSEKLKDKLNDLGLRDGNVEFETFKEAIHEGRKNDEIFYLAEDFRRLHHALHVEVIGNKEEENGLCFLYYKVSQELTDVLESFEENKPWFVRYQFWIVVVATFALVALLTR